MLRSGYDIAWAWLHDPEARPNHAEGWKDGQGSWVWAVAELDWDYHMAYLLEVRAHDETTDQLAVYQRHAPGDYPDPGLEVAWWGQREPISGSQDFLSRELRALHWFVAWAHERRVAHVGVQPCPLHARAQEAAPESGAGRAAV